MAGLQRGKLKGGKYPIVLRRDGTVLQTEYFVLALKDPGAPFALRAYADAAELVGMDPEYVEDIRELAVHADWCVRQDAMRKEGPTADPDGAPHRSECPDMVQWRQLIEQGETLSLSELIDYHQSDTFKRNGS